MKKTKVFFALLVLTSIVMLAFGCAETPAEEPEEEVVEEAEDEDEEEEPEEEEEEDQGRKVVDGQVRSFLSGKWVDEEIGTRRPVAVMLNNIKAAIPQSGISKADVVYEATVEGNITRLMGIFEDYDDLSKIGSVRSCRDYFVYYALNFDAVYAHYGQAAYALDLLGQDYVNNLSGLSSESSTVFYRTSDRKAPHNAYTSGDGLAAGIELLGYRTDYLEGYAGNFSFAADDEPVVLEDGTAAKKIVNSAPINEPYFEYDEANDVYKRFQYGAAHIDDMTGEQLTYTNVILQVSEWETRDANGYLAFDCHSGGTAYYITGGRMIECTWIKFGDQGYTKYYAVSDGEEIVINQGKTWVSIIQDTKFDQVSITG